MSNYKKGDWSIILDALYYNFINKNKEYLGKNYSTAKQVAFWNKKTKGDKEKILKTAKKYLYYFHK